MQTATVFSRMWTMLHLNALYSWPDRDLSICFRAPLIYAVCILSAIAWLRHSIEMLGRAHVTFHLLQQSNRVLESRT